MVTAIVHAFVILSVTMTSHTLTFPTPSVPIPNLIALHSLCKPLLNVHLAPRTLPEAGDPQVIRQRTNLSVSIGHLL
jgi:hypothetical protein